MNLLVDDERKARLNRQRVANGYCNEGYDLESNSERGMDILSEPSWNIVSNVMSGAMGPPHEPFLGRDREIWNTGLGIDWDFEEDD